MNERTHDDLYYSYYVEEAHEYYSDCSELEDICYEDPNEDAHEAWFEEAKKQHQAEYNHEDKLEAQIERFEKFIAEYRND